MIRALWDDLAAGKNLDELHLRGDDKHGGGADRPVKAITPEVESRAKAASVRIRMEKNDRGWSGTIVSSDGVVTTCAHGLNFVMPGTKVIVCLPDGRDAAGEIVGHNHVCDVCVVRITDKGTWPHVEMGHSIRMRPGDPCLFFGYGAAKDNARQPIARRTAVVEQWSAYWTHDLDLDAKVTWYGGDSGGGVFDADGSLVGYFLGGRVAGNPHIARRIELFRAHQDEIRGPYEQAAPAPALALKAGGG